MRNFISKEVRISSNLNKNGKFRYHKLLVYTILSFAIGAFGFFEALYNLCNVLGSIVSGSPQQAVVELTRIFPNILAVGSLLYVPTLFHRYGRQSNEEYPAKLALKSGIALTVGGFLMAIYVLVGLATGTYHSFIEGAPTPIFPLDSFLLGLVYVGMGISFIVLRKKMMSPDRFILPTVKQEKGSGFASFGKAIFFIAASWAFAAFIYGLFIVDFEHGHYFYIISLFLMLLVPIAMLAIYQFVYTPLKLEFRREFKLYFSNIVLAVSLLVFIIYMIALSLDPNAPNDVAYGILPVEFTASVNAFTYIFALVNLLPPFIVSLKTLFAKEKK